MATLTIRNLDDSLKSKLRVRAAEHGWSMEAEVRAILHIALHDNGDTGGLGSRMHERFSAIGGVDLELPDRRDTARAAQFPE